MIYYQWFEGRTMKRRLGQDSQAGCAMSGSPPHYPMEHWLVIGAWVIGVIAMADRGNAEQRFGRGTMEVL